jgi:hypothetical protein
MGIVIPHQEATHRQNSQERSLASILQSNHGDVHLGRPEQAEKPVIDATEEVRHGCGCDGMLTRCWRGLVGKIGDVRAMEEAWEP